MTADVTGQASVVDQAAAVLAEHLWQATFIRSGPAMDCSCGAKVDNMQDHQAAALDEAGLLAAGETSTEALAKGWDEGHRAGWADARTSPVVGGWVHPKVTANPYADTASEWVPVSDQATGGAR